MTKLYNIEGWADTQAAEVYCSDCMTSEEAEAQSMTPYFMSECLSDPQTCALCGEWLGEVEPDDVPEEVTDFPGERREHMTPVIRWGEWEADEDGTYPIGTQSDATPVQGKSWGYRMTAPGYLDATDWVIGFPTYNEARLDCIQSHDLCQKCLCYSPDADVCEKCFEPEDGISHADAYPHRTV